MKNKKIWLFLKLVSFTLVCLAIILLLSAQKFFVKQPKWGIPILMYHNINNRSLRFSVSPDNFRSHLKKLYDAGFVTARLEDVIANKPSLRSKRIVILRFDDSYRSQCNYLVDKKGTVTLDQQCAVGILLDFCKDHPSFGTHAIFCLIPSMCFQQRQFRKDKCMFLLNHGMELANHGYNHVSITDATPATIDANFGKAMAFFHQLLGPVVAEITSVATPFGTVPRDPQAENRLRCFSYEGISYPQAAVMYAGRRFTDMSHTPWCPHFDQYRLPCFEVTNDNFDRILASIQ